MTTTLVIRLSSLGDVAIALPVLYSVAPKYPEDLFLLVTHHEWRALFVNAPPNLIIFPTDTKGKHKGLRGIIRLLRELSRLVGTQSTQNLKLADLHGVIRSLLIGGYFRLKGIPVATIDKGRKEKRALVRKKHKVRQTLKSALARYQEVFQKLGYDASLCFGGLFLEKQTKECTRIGIAPFSRHPCKTYPLELMEEVVSRLSKWPDTQNMGEPQSMELVLLGSEEEGKSLAHWAKKHRNVSVAAGKLSLEEELSLMNSMDLVLSMDSANMHLASLVNTPVVSIWGATHPDAGFYGWNQNKSNAIQIELPCRPCSVFGNKPCHRGDHACLKQITPEMIVNKIQEVMKSMQTK